jgi:hypothetical protein
VRAYSISAGAFNHQHDAYEPSGLRILAHDFGTVRDTSVSTGQPVQLTTKMIELIHALVLIYSLWYEGEPCRASPYFLGLSRRDDCRTVTGGIGIVN